MDKRYRIKLKDGRIIGPFFKEEIGSFYLKGHLEGDEKCQIFPVGDWMPIRELEDIGDYVCEIIEQKNHEDNIVDDPNIYKEFEYEKETQININYEELEKKVTPPQKGLEQTKIIRRKHEVNIDKTIAKKVQEEAPDSPEEKNVPEFPEEKNVPESPEEPSEEKEEPIDADAATKVLNARLDLVEVQKEVESFEEESLKNDDEKKEARRREIGQKIKLKKVTKKKKITPIVALAIFVVFYFLLFDDSGQDGQKGPQLFEIKVPIAYKVEHKKKALNLLNSGKVLYAKGDYLSKRKAAQNFHLSVSHQYRNNEALGYLIRAYAELYPNVPEKKKGKAAINLHKIIQTAASKYLKDINAAMGAALFYHHIGKNETALFMIENYLRVSPPSKKLFCLYLDVLVAAEKLEKASKALEQVKSIIAEEKVPWEAYVSIAKFYQFNEEQDKALETIKEGLKKYPTSVPILIQLAEIKKKELESLELSLKDPVFLKELSLFIKILKLIEKQDSGHSPAYYAKYLEFTGLVSAVQGDSDTAAKLFKVSLAINNSVTLRSKLATLTLGGGGAAEKLIRENKIVELMKESKRALKERKWKQAFAYAFEAVEYNENHIPAQLLLIDIQIKRGYYDDAIKNLKELNRIHKKSKEIYVRLVDAYLKVKKFKNAYQKIVEMNRIQKFGQTAEFASLQGKYFLKKGNDLLSSKWFQESISRNPLNDYNYFELSKIYLRNRSYARSKSALSKALALMPTKAEYHIAYATILYEHDSPEVGIGYLRKVLESDQDNKDILGQIAIFYYRNGQHKEFELYKKELEKAVLQNTLFYSFLARASILDGNYKDTEKYSRLLLESNPGDIDVRMLLGKTLYDAKDYVRAIEVFGRILDRLKSYPQVYYYLAKIYMEQKKFKDALSLAEKEIKGNPELYYGYYIKGEIYRRMGKWPLAVKSLEKAISIDTNSVETLVALGWINLRQNFAEKARELYLRAKAKDENNPEVRKQLGLIYRDIGQKALAIDELNIYLQLKPDAPDRRDIEFTIRLLSR